MSILILGAGGVGSAVTHKSAQNNDVLGDITLASRTVSKCEKIIESVHRKGNLKNSSGKLEAATVDVEQPGQLVALLREKRPDLVINVGSPWINPPVMEACLETGIGYMDTSVAVDLCSEGQLVPDAYDPQWIFRERFEQAGICAILSTGFDPGAVNAYAAYAQKHLFDEIESVDIMDVNGGDHGHKFATNFDPVANITEIIGDSFYWDKGQWERVPCHTRCREFDFPEIGRHKVYSMAHDEIRSLAEYLPSQHIEFWMGFGENYLNYFNVLRDIGMFSEQEITTGDGTTVAPLQVLKALLPDPASLAPGYTGKTCIGDLVKGTKDGQEREVFIYNICDHEEAYKEIDNQAISYTTAVPCVAAALLYFDGTWRKPGIWNVEQLDPDPYLERMSALGLPWEVMELTPVASH